AAAAGIHLPGAREGGAVVKAMTDRYEKIRKALSHEIWAAAQLAPGEGIVDGAARVEALLREALAALKAENEMLRESLKDADNEMDWLDEDMDTCDHSVGVCMCSYW